jgi:hypothetical protein
MTNFTVTVTAPKLAGRVRALGAEQQPPLVDRDATGLVHRNRRQRRHRLNGRDAVRAQGDALDRPVLRVRTPFDDESAVAAAAVAVVGEVVGGDGQQGPRRAAGHRHRADRVPHGAVGIQHPVAHRADLDEGEWIDQMPGDLRMIAVDDVQARALEVLVERVEAHPATFNADGFDFLYPKYPGGRPRTFILPERREVKKIAKSKPTEHGLPFST